MGNSCGNGNLNKRFCHFEIFEKINEQKVFSLPIDYFRVVAYQIIAKRRFEYGLRNNDKTSILIRKDEIGVRVVFMAKIL